MLPLLIAFLQLSAATAAERKRPPESLALIDQARSLTPEFASDILLRLAGSRLIGDSKWKAELIEEAFQDGAHAQLPYRQKGEPSTDTRSSRAVWDNGVEALTLQTRAIEAMLRLDPQRGRALFDEIPSPDPPPLTCQQVPTPDVSAYYVTAANVFRQGFTPRQREKEEHVWFLRRVAGAIRSPAQVGPAVRLITRVPLTPAQFETVASSLVAALDAIGGSPRGIQEYSGVDLRPDRTVDTRGAGRTGSVTVPSTLPVLGPNIRAIEAILIPALRAFLVRQAAAPRCKDDFRTLPQVLMMFNSTVGNIDPSGAVLKPISEDEAKSDRDGGTYEPHPWWQSDRSKQVLDALKWLNHGNRNLPEDKRFWTLEERQSTEWGAHFNDTLALIEGWKAEEEDSFDDWFGMVSEAYELLAEKAPPGERREVAMGRFVSFMETHYALVENHNLWFTQLHDLWRSKEPWIRDRLSRSTNPVIAVYTKVNQLASH